MCQIFLASCSCHDYNFVVVDNPFGGPFGQGIYCEHFDIFPFIFNYTSDEFVIILNLQENISSYFNNGSMNHPNKMNWLVRRKEFYALEQEDDPIKINLSKLINIYKAIFAKSAVEVDKIFYVPRSDLTGFLVIKGQKQGNEMSGSGTK